MLLGQKKKCHVWNRQLLQLSWGLSFPRSSSPAHTYPAGDQGDYKIRRKWVISRLKTPKLIHKHLVHEELTRLFNYTWCGGTSPPLSPAHLFHIGTGTAAPCCAPRPRHLEAQEGCPWLELYHGLAADKAPAPSTLRCSHCHGKQHPDNKKHLLAACGLGSSHKTACHRGARAGELCRKPGELCRWLRELCRKPGELCRWPRELCR